jgi:peroxin-19
MLDEFTPSKPEPKAPSGPGRPPANTTTPPPDFGALGEGLSDDEFAKQLQAGMAELMGELDTSPDMQAQFENMLKELGGAAALGEAAGLGGPGSGPSTSTKEKGVSNKEKPASKGSAAAGSASEESFQETIAKTMERMRASGDQATAAAASDNTDDILAEMMKAMQSGGLDGEGGEEEFSKMLLGMMEQLTNKEILYEPMKELDDKFPAWMEKNTGKVEEADMKRYKEQQIYVREIVQRFETKGYKDENAADREYIVERMQKVSHNQMEFSF